MYGVPDFQLAGSGDADTALGEIDTSAFRVRGHLSLRDSNLYALVELKSRETALNGNHRLFHSEHLEPSEPSEQSRLEYRIVAQSHWHDY